MSCDFSLNHLRETLERSLAKGYSFLTLSEYLECDERPKKLVLLRHDIDYSIADMFDIAEIEQDLGIRSTIFIRIHSRFYNPFDKDNFQRIAKLKRMGHEIGLHFEPIFASKNALNLRLLLIKDLRILEEAFNIRVRGISVHLAKRSNLEISEKLEWIQLGISKNGDRHIMRYSADSRCLSIVFPDLFKDCIFLKDTNAKWGGRSLCESVGKDPFIYVLLHPVWWNSRNRMLKDKIIKKLANGW